MAAIEAEGVVAGDVVTLKKTSAPAWAETRRYDGTAWQAISPLFSGEAIVEKTLPASRLKIDDTVLGQSAEGDALTLSAVPANLITTGVLRSSNYEKDQAGFSIDTAGTAELNNAHIRGVLESAEIKSSVMVASTRVIPTEEQTAFFTLENERPITYERRSLEGQRLDLGPMMIDGTVNTRRFGDGRKKVLACNNPKGATAGQLNGEYSRFWAKTPVITAVFRYDAVGTPWGEDITHGKVRVTLKTSGGRVLATSPLYRLDQRKGLGNRFINDVFWRDRKRDHTKTILLPFIDGFHLNSKISLIRKVAVHPTNGQSYTESLDITVTAGAQFIHDAARDNDNTGLMMSCDFDFTEDFPTSTGQQSKVLTGLYFSSQIKSDTHS